MAYIKKRSLFRRLQFELEQKIGIYWEGRLHKFSSGMRENKYLVIYKKEPNKIWSEREYQFFYDETTFIKRANEILLLYGKNSILYAGKIYFAYDYGVKRDSA
jgi:hypothetical protein